MSPEAPLSLLEKTGSYSAFLVSRTCEQKTTRLLDVPTMQLRNKSLHAKVEKHPQA